MSTSTIVIKSTEWCWVYCDGEYKCELEANVVGKITVSPGQHIIELKSPALLKNGCSVEISTSKVVSVEPGSSAAILDYELESSKKNNFFYDEFLPSNWRPIRKG